VVGEPRGKRPQVSDGTQLIPAVFVFADASDGVDYTDNWSIARDQVYAAGKPIFIGLKVWENSADKYRNHGDKFAETPAGLRRRPCLGASLIALVKVPIELWPSQTKGLN